MQHKRAVKIIEKKYRQYRMRKKIGKWGKTAEKYRERPQFVEKAIVIQRFMRKLMAWKYRQYQEIIMKQSMKKQCFE